MDTTAGMATMALAMPINLIWSSWLWHILTFFKHFCRGKAIIGHGQNTLTLLAMEIVAIPYQVFRCIYFQLFLVSPETICLTFSSGVWSKSHTLKSPREMHSSWSSSNGTFLIGGKKGIQIFTSVELGRYVENCIFIKWFSNVFLVTDNEDSEYSSIQLLNET